MPPSSPLRDLGGLIVTISFTLLYMKTWECPQDVMETFYNIATDLCQECGVVGCTDCESLYKCAQCSMPDDYFNNATSELCDPCAVVGCIDCENSADYCIACNTTLGYYLIDSNNSCGICLVPDCITCSSSTVCVDCEPAYFEATGGLSCDACSSNCLSCTSLATCTACDESGGYFLNPSNQC